jgi:hypothetical protein
MTIEQRIKACLGKHPEWEDGRVCNSIRGTKIEMVRAVREGRPLAETVPDTGTIDFAKVRERYDIAAAIRAELAKLKPGTIIPERELCQRAAAKDNARFRRAVGNNADEFRKNRIKLALKDDPPEGRFYWGSAKDVQEATRLRDE